MADTMKKNYQISGSGVLCIDGNDIFVLVEDKGTFNLAAVLADFNNKPIKFNFSYDEEYSSEETMEANEEFDEIL